MVHTGSPASASASAQDLSGSTFWAYNNLDTRWEYRTDCASFVSKALDHGGRNSSIIPHEENAKVEDLVFFKWKRERGYHHAAIVSSMVQGHAGIVQHGPKNQTTSTR
ncbi:hypothetical protein [Streptomyces sp. NPDC007905]|uniref:hypothetical protein n=1 Tax=Streptomyces sp. NPDC007905 TaxID=3364788 RepID=UPI0036EB2263